MAQFGLGVNFCTLIYPDYDKMQCNVDKFKHQKYIHCCCPLKSELFEFQAWVALFVWTPVLWHRAGTCLGMAFLCKHTRNTETCVYKYRYADVRNVLRWDIYVNIHQLSMLGASYLVNCYCQKWHIHQSVKFFDKDLVENKAKIDGFLQPLFDLVTSINLCGNDDSD